jgi:hypothetical protein
MIAPNLSPNKVQIENRKKIAVSREEKKEQQKNSSKPIIIIKPSHLQDIHTI